MDKENPSPGAGLFGLVVFLLSLASLFAATLVAYWAVRLDAPSWPPPGAPGLPRVLWASTAALLASSATMHAAWLGARRGSAGLLRGGLVLTSALGLVFLVLQASGWHTLQGELGFVPPAQLDPSGHVHGVRHFAGTFYLLTALHAAHVVGGLIPLLVTTGRALRGAYSPARRQGVTLCAVYWHFLEAVWLIIFVTLVAFE